MIKVLKDVVIWPKRIGPTRVLPNHLKLAILSRGQISLPANAVTWFLDVIKSRGEALRLTVDPRKIAETFPTIFELFINQRLSLSANEIDECIAEYLTIRRKGLTSSCFLILWTWLPAGDFLQIENSLEVEISRLFSRAKVRIARGEPLQYILLSYICLPSSVARFLSSSKGTTPSSPPPSPGMPVLEGYTKPSAQFHLRKEPDENSESLGVQAGSPVRVQVLDKYFREILWHKIRLLEPMRLIPKPDDIHSRAFDRNVGTEAWISSQGLDFIIAPWSLFRNDVIAFEQKESNQSLDQRITSLRQRLHARNLPFDAVIGTKQGNVYQDDIRYEPGKWQLGKDYDAVRTPDDRCVDIQHLMVALDVLPRDERWTVFMGNAVGTNWAASTWSGDVGAAATDATLRVDSIWESWNTGIALPERVEHYFLTRVSDRDLLGDIDGWGISQLRRNRADLNTLDGFLTTYYEDISPGGARTLTAPRADALKAFARHYGFTYSLDRDRYPALVNQDRAARRMLYEIKLFANIWMIKRIPVAHNRPVPSFAGEMTGLFLYWLECALIENGVNVS